MKYKFTKTKPPFKLLWKDIQEMFTKPVAGHTVDVIQLSMLIALSTKDFNDYKRLMKPDLTESELKEIPLTSGHKPAKIYTQLEDLIPNPHKFPLNMLCALLSTITKVDYSSITDEPLSKHPELKKCFHAYDSYKDESVIGKIGKSSILYDNIKQYFPTTSDTVVEVSDKADLKYKILRMHLEGETELPTFKLTLPQAQEPTVDISGYEDEDAPEYPEETLPDDAPDTTPINGNELIDKYIRVQGNRAQLGYIYNREDIIGGGISDYAHLTRAQYTEQRSMYINSRDDIKVPGAVKALVYDIGANKIDIVKLEKPDFSNLDPHTIILRYKEI